MLISNNWKTIHVLFALCQGKGLSARKVSVNRESDAKPKHIIGPKAGSGTMIKRNKA